jgi:hypothetical protein
MTVAVAMYTTLEHADAVAVAASKTLSTRTGEAHAILIVGLIAIAVGLGSLIYGLRAEWKRTHIHYRRRRD